MVDLKAKIALVISPPFWIKTPPLGLEYLKNYLKDYAQPDIFDLNIYFYGLFKYSPKKWLGLNKDFEDNLFRDAEKKFAKELNAVIKKLSAYSYVGFSLFKRNLNFSSNLAERIKYRSKKTEIIFGGPQTRETKKLRPKDSIIVEGEGEIPLLKILRQNKDRHFAYQEIKDLDEIYFNDFKQYDLSLYKPVLPLLSSRGCIKKCRFCSEYTLYKKFRQHSQDYMIEQIEYLIKLYKIRRFSFQDSLINADVNWLEIFCKKIIEKRLNIQWEAQLAIREGMDKKLLSLMKKAGCLNLFVGLESGSDETLKNMGKGFTCQDARGFLSNLKQADLSFEVSIIVGYPKETEQDFKKTLLFLKENRNLIPRIAQVSSFSLYKNSSLCNHKNLEQIEPKVISNRMKKIIRFIEKEKIRHKKAFIDNLSYH
ncbi:MAG: B12-binding domain-containing radical SAM protein [Candidatus Omnitrophica bacterium]|nr:B12-binding domain-containing radical SAM protein [Candidatus Omnitrophota bacterium]